MKKTKRILSASIAAAMLVGTGSLIPMTANAEAVDWDNISEWADEWLPTSFIGALNFHNFEGAVQVKDDTICIVKHVPTAYKMKADITAIFKDETQRADADYESHIYRYDFDVPEAPDKRDSLSYSYYRQEMEDYESTGLVKDGKAAYHYEVLVICNNTADGFNVNVKLADEKTGEKASDEVTYTFAREDGELKETDMYSWLPDSHKEMEKYIDRYGEVSYKDGMLVYCTGVNRSDKKIDAFQSGEGKLKLIAENVVERDDMALLDGVYPYMMKVFKGEAEGDVDVEFGQQGDKASASVDKDMNVKDRTIGRPEWIPWDYETAVEFMKKNGPTFVKDGVICLVRKVNSSSADHISYAFEGSAAEKIDDYRLLHKFVKNPSGYLSNYDISAYNIPEDTELTVKFLDGTEKNSPVSKEYSFKKDSEGNAIQTDKYGWYPDSDGEFEEFRDKHGDFAILNGMVIYCDNLYSKSARFWTKQCGTGEFTEEKEEYFTSTGSSGNTTHYIKRFVPKTPGVVEIRMEKTNTTGYINPQTKSSAKTAYFRIDEKLNITPATKEDMKTDIKGDCNCDGVLGISDAVALQKWLHGDSRYSDVSEYGDADANRDDVIDVFDLIELRKAIINKLSEPPKPVMVTVSENFTMGASYFVTIYDQYGSEYNLIMREEKADMKKYREKNVIIDFDGDKWYERMQDIIEKAAVTEEIPEDKSGGSEYFEGYYSKKHAIPDRMSEEINKFIKKTKSLSGSEMTSVKKTSGNGETTVYLINTDADVKPVYAAIAESGDSVGWIDNKDVKDFVKMMKRYCVFGDTVIEVLS